MIKHISLKTLYQVFRPGYLCSHPADVLQNQLHLVRVDGRQDKDESDNVNAVLGHIFSQIVFS